MKSLKTLAAVTLAATFLAAPATVLAADKKAEKLKPYPLKVCVVTDEKLDKDATVWSYQGREIKFCCKDCEKDFLKEPAKYLKKIEDAEKKK
jgi:YHS domain-containing protein